MLVLLREGQTTLMKSSSASAGHGSKERSKEASASANVLFDQYSFEMMIGGSPSLWLEKVAKKVVVSKPVSA